MTSPAARTHWVGCQRCDGHGIYEGKDCPSCSGDGGIWILPPPLPDPVPVSRGRPQHMPIDVCHVCSTPGSINSTVDVQTEPNYEKDEVIMTARCLQCGERWRRTVPRYSFDALRYQLEAARRHA